MIFITTFGFENAEFGIPTWGHFVQFKPCMRFRRRRDGTRWGWGREPKVHASGLQWLLIQRETALSVDGDHFIIAIKILLVQEWGLRGKQSTYALSEREANHQLWLWMLSWWGMASLPLAMSWQMDSAILVIWRIRKQREPWVKQLRRRREDSTLSHRHVGWQVSGVCGPRPPRVMWLWHHAHVVSQGCTDVPELVNVIYILQRSLNLQKS